MFRFTGGDVAPQRDTGKCPVLPYAFQGVPEAALSAFRRNDTIQDQAPTALWTEDAQGYWVFTDHDVILDGMQQTLIFQTPKLQGEQLQFHQFGSHNGQFLLDQLEASNGFAKLDTRLRVV